MLDPVLRFVPVLDVEPAVVARAVGAAARADLAAELEVLQGRSDPLLTAIADKRRGQLADIEAFSAVYRRYTWDVGSVNDLRLAPFHLLASHNKVHSSEPHSGTWSDFDVWPRPIRR